jgi:hypothetical protein
MLAVSAAGRAQDQPAAGPRRRRSRTGRSVRRDGHRGASRRHCARSGSTARSYRTGSIRRRGCDCGNGRGVRGDAADAQLLRVSKDCRNVPEGERTRPTARNVATTIRRILPTAVAKYARLGRALSLALAEDAASEYTPRRATKTDRNDPCPCAADATTKNAAEPSHRKFEAAIEWLRSDDDYVVR